MKGVKLQLLGVSLLVLSLHRPETISKGQLLLCALGLVLSLLGLAVWEEKK